MQANGLAAVSCSCSTARGVSASDKAAGNRSLTISAGYGSSRPAAPPDRATCPREPGHFPSRQTIGWKELDDYPHPEEHEGLGLKYTYDFKAGTVQLDCQELALTFKDVRDEQLAETVASAVAGDKLAGWPSWVQGADYPKCPRCERRMDLVFQIDSEDNVPFMWGDVGCGHITQCPDHKDVVAFGWACF